MRNPILNIHKSDLESILDKMGVQIDLKTLFLEAKKCSVKYSIDEKSFLKYNKIAEAEHVGKFNMTLMAIQQRTNPNAQVIRQQDSAYMLLKEITILATDFCNANNLTIDRGFSIYIQAGLDIMGKKYGLNKFKTYNQKICASYEHEQIIKNNPNKGETDLIIKIYKQKTTVTKSDTIHFVYAAAEVVENGAKVEDWMKAQFDRLEWTGKIPEPYQLYGDNAKEAWQKIKPVTIIKHKGNDWTRDRVL